VAFIPQNLNIFFMQGFMTAYLLYASVHIAVRKQKVQKYLNTVSSSLLASLQIILIKFLAYLLRYGDAFLEPCCRKSKFKRTVFGTVPFKRIDGVNAILKFFAWEFENIILVVPVGV